MDKTVLFWILFGVIGFAFALAVQMRVVIAKVLRMSAKAKFPETHDRDLVAIVRSTPDRAADLVSGLQPIKAYIQQNHGGAVRHLSIARRYSMILPVILLGVVAIGRFGLGVI